MPPAGASWPTRGALRAHAHAQVVLDQADSSSLPPNALAPAPPLTSRGRKAAAATAARKAAAAAKAAMRALQQRAAADAAALAHGASGTRRPPRPSQPRHVPATPRA